MIGRRDERLLDRPGRGPAQQVQRRTGLVVGARCAGAAERLLADDGPGGFVVDVEVPGGMPETLFRLQHRSPVVVRVGVDVDGEDRSEVLVRERLVGRIVGQHYGGPNEIAFGIVVFAADRHGDTGGTLGSLDGRDVLGECAVVDQRATEVAQIRHITVGQCLGGAEEVVTHALPERPWDKSPRGRRALLALVVEGPPDERGAQHIWARRGVCDHEILAAGLPDQSGIGVVAVDVRSDLPPQVLERGGRPGEVDAGQPWVGEDDLGYRDAVAGDEVDHARGQARRLQKLHREVRRESLGR